MLDLVLAIGIIASLLNIGDFILRPQQKESFQKGMENLVLWLDYKRPLNLISNIRSLKRWHLCCIGFSLLIISLTILQYYHNLYVARVGLFFVIYSLTIIQSVPWWRWATHVFDHIDPHKGILQILFRSIILVLVNIIVTVIFILIAKFTEIGSIVFVLVLLPIYIFRLRWIMAFNAAVSVSIIALSACSFLFIIESLVRILRIIGWRIIEYSKGAWAAIILLATTILSLIKLFVK